MKDECMGYPQVGERVIVTRLSGKKMTARLDILPTANCRDNRNLHWLTDDNKYAYVNLDPIVSWERVT